MQFFIQTWLIRPAMDAIAKLREDTDMKLTELAAAIHAQAVETARIKAEIIARLDSLEAAIGASSSDVPADVVAELDALRTEVQGLDALAEPIPPAQRPRG